MEPLLLGELQSLGLLGVADGSGGVVASVGSGSGAFSLYAAHGDGVLKVSGSSGYCVPLASRPALVRALAAVNAALSEGTAEMDVVDGELRFRVSLPAAPRAGLQPLVQHVLRVCIAGYPPLAAAMEPLARTAGSRRPTDAELEAAAKAVADDVAARLALA